MPYYEAKGHWGILKKIGSMTAYIISHWNDMICYYFNGENNEEN